MFSRKVVICVFWLAGFTTALAENESATAVKQASAAFSRFWTQCGDIWVTSLDAPRVYMQFKKMTPTVSQDKLTSADTLNGITWRGTVLFRAEAYRTFYFQKTASGGPGWEPWSTGGRAWLYQLTLTNGQWRLVEKDVYPKDAKPVACEIVNSARVDAGQ